MGQGISVRNLGEDKLITGIGNPEDGLQSCSAVMLFNKRTRAAGLYHFPAGDIEEDSSSRQILQSMADAVIPTEAYIYYGTVTLSYAFTPSVIPSDPHAGVLRSFVLRLLPFGCRLRRGPAQLAIVSLAQNDGTAIIEEKYPKDDYKDLRDIPPGVYQHYQLYRDY